MKFRLNFIMMKAIGIFVILFFGCMIPTQDVNAEIYGDFEYVILNDGTVRIQNYKGVSEYVDIPSQINGMTVTQINRQVFSSYITGVKVPATVTKIHMGSWSNNIALESIEVDANNPVYNSQNNCNAIIETATNNLVVGCRNTIIPNNVESINEYAFWGCRGLESITLPGTIKTIGPYAFSDCYSLKQIVLPNSVEKISSEAFSECDNLVEVYIPESVSDIATNAFSDCNKLTTIVVAPNNKVYDSRDNCNAIIETATNALTLVCKNTVIPKSVTTIKNRVYANCSWLTSIYIDSNITNIGENVFYFCENLAEIRVSSNNPVYDSRNNCNAIIHTETNTLIDGCYNTMIPPTVKTIAVNAFVGCKKLKKIYIPSSVATIGYGAFTGNSSGLEIHGISGTEAQRYAERCRFTFVEHTTHTNEKYITPADANRKTEGILIKKCSLCGKVSSTETISYPEKVVLSAKSFVYDGTKRTPTVIVRRKDSKTISSENYSIVLDDNSTKVGVYTCKVVFSNVYYKGTLTAEYTIVPRSTEIKSLDNTPEGILIQWPKNSQASGYKIYRSMDGTNFEPIKTISNMRTTSYVDKEANRKGRNYYYKIYTYNNASGRMLLSAGSSVKKINRVIVKPTGIESLTNATNGVTIKWKKNEEASGYRIYRSINDEEFKVIKVVHDKEVLSYLDAAATENGKKYIYKICAYKDVSGKIIYAPESTAKAIYRLTRTTIRIVSAQGSYRMMLVWDNNTVADGYEVQYSIDSNLKSGVYTKSISIPSTNASTVSKEIQMADKKTGTHYMRVRAYKEVAGKKYYSPWSSITSGYVSR